MERIILYITNIMIEQDIIHSHEKEWCQYILEKWLLEICGYSLIILAGFINKCIIETLIFMITFLSMRKRTGGYHTERACTCMALSFMITCSLPAGLKYIQQMSDISKFIILLFISLIIYLFAPINHPNMNMSVEEIKGNKILAYRNYLVFVFAILFSDVFGAHKVSNSIIYGLILSSISILIAKILKQEVNHES